MKKYPITKVCKTLEISRSNQYQNRKPRAKRYRRKDDEQVLDEIRQIAKDRSTYGYRRTAGMLCRKRKSEGLTPYNPKRIYRLMEMDGLLISRSTVHSERDHTGQIVTIFSDLRYCSDILEIRCWNGEKVHVAFSLDCHDREAMAFVARPHHLCHTDIMDLMDKTVVQRFGPNIESLPRPIEWLSDNGSQYTANETKSYGKGWGFIVRTTPAYSPESNGMSEAFVGTFKRDYAHTHELLDAASVIRQLPGWFEDYNNVAPHSGLGYLSPREYREKEKVIKDEAVGCPINGDFQSGRCLGWGKSEKKVDNQGGLGLLNTVSV
jgi:putative transposase